MPMIYNLMKENKMISLHILQELKSSVWSERERLLLSVYSTTGAEKGAFYLAVAGHYEPSLWNVTIVQIDDVNCQTSACFKCITVL